MDRKLRNAITLFLLQLVLSLPFYTTSAYAAISGITVKGSDNLEGFARSNDFLNFIVRASIGNQTIAREQVRLGASILFDKCSPLPNDAHECTLKFPAAGKQDFEAKEILFTINLFKDKAGAQIEDSKTGSVLIDNKAPEAKLSLAKNRLSSRDSLMLNYEAADFACNDASCSGRCVGLKGLELSSPAGFKESIDLANIAGCTAKDALSIDIKKFKDGPNQISGRASDKFGFVSQNVSVQFIIDTKGPQILANTLRILRRGISLKAFSPQSVPVEISIDVSADDLEPNSVTADFTNLNPSQGLENAKAICAVVKSGLYRCRWSINLNPASETLVEETDEFQDSSEPKAAKAANMAIAVNASDLSGNTEGVTISPNLALDDQGPVVQSLTTGIVKDNKVFARASGNTVTAVLSEATGLSPEEVVLHVDSTRLQPKSCRKDSNFLCIWENAAFTAPKTIIAIKSDTVDFLLNPVKEEKTLEVIVDDAAPVLKGISFTPVGSFTDALPETFKVEDKIAVEANVTEENELTAIGNFSRFVSKASKAPGDCKRLQANDYTCTWLTDSIDVGGSGFMGFNFSDIVGNSLVVNTPLTVLELETSKMPDFWKNANTCLPNGGGQFMLSPAKIDRQLGTLISQRAYCSVKLEPKTPRQTSIILMSDAECKGDGLKLVEQIATLNTEAGSTSPIIKMTLKKDELRVDEINISCMFGIISRVDDKITKNPELEEVNISIGLYNFPLGEFSKSVQDNIDGAKKEAKEYLKFVGNLNTIVEFSKKSCQAINTIYTGWTAIHIIVDALKKLQASTTAIPGVNVATERTATGSCLAAEKGSDAADKFKAKTDKFCDWVTCKRGVFGRYDQKGGGNLLEKWTSVFGPGAYYDEKSQNVAIDNLRGIDYGRYMDPQNSLFVALIPPTCIPGVITGLEKLRQIKCLYADCLQNAVARDGIPPSACDDLKAHTTCKYIAGEVFAVIPWTAFADHWTRLAKNALSNPFTVLGLPIAVYCEKFCHEPTGFGYNLCRGTRLFSLLGDTIENVKGMIDQGSFFKVRQDYCSRIEDEADEEEEEEESQNAQSSQTGQTQQSQQTQQGTQQSQQQNPQQTNP